MAGSGTALTRPEVTCCLDGCPGRPAGAQCQARSGPALGAAPAGRVLSGVRGDDNPGGQSGEDVGPAAGSPARQGPQRSSCSRGRGQGAHARQGRSGQRDGVCRGLGRGPVRGSEQALAEPRVTWAASVTLGRQQTSRSRRTAVSRSDPVSPGCLVAGYGVGAGRAGRPALGVPVARPSMGGRVDPAGGRVGARWLVSRFWTESGGGADGACRPGRREGDRALALALSWQAGAGARPLRGRWWPFTRAGDGALSGGV